MALPATLKEWQEAIHVTMGWTISHLWEFEINGRRYVGQSASQFGKRQMIFKAKSA